VAIGKRLKGRSLGRFRYRDFGSLVSLAHYRTFGNVIGGLKIEEPVAKLMYRALYRMHLRSIHGNVRTAFDTLAEFITRRTEPRTKLH
jgi:NADH dehydrogenase